MTTTTPTVDDPADLRTRYAALLAAQGAITSDAWHQAFADVPREVFVPQFSVRHRPGGLTAYTAGDPGYAQAVYTDTSLLTQWDDTGTATSSSSEPSTMAVMLEALDVADGDRVLEIGVGTGYNAALLCHRLGDERVTTLDIDPSLVDVARTRLHHAGFRPIVLESDGTAGAPHHGPFDRLIATCGFGRVPDAWRAQMHVGGVIVVNLGLGLARLTIADDHSTRGHFLPQTAAFMTARQAPGTRPPRAADRAGELHNAVGETTTTLTVPEQAIGTTADEFLGSLLQPAVESMPLTVRGRTCHYLVHPAGHWSRLSLLGSDRARVDSTGPDLWRDRADLLRYWADAGRPAPTAIGIEISTQGEHTITMGPHRVLLP